MKTSRVWLAIPLSSVCWVSSGCGVVGPPIPPENVGVAPTIEKQKREQAQQVGQQPGVIDGPQTEGPQFIPPRGQDEELPPLRPVGTR